MAKIEIEAELWRGMTDYLRALHEHDAVDDIKMKLDASYLPLKECLEIWGIETPIPDHKP